ncbi:hypothetical protein SAMN02910358_00720 [Lachnospiraceae bacterium XBB1006]|nr:hypothetical protein SAMN02910358_00720 [Lachnospiraceae bacterium XBB1006]
MQWTSVFYFCIIRKSDKPTALYYIHKEQINKHKCHRSDAYNSINM